MSVRRVMGTETEYGISVPGQPGANAMVTSSQVVNAYAGRHRGQGAAGPLGLRGGEPAARRARLRPDPRGRRLLASSPTRTSGWPTSSSPTAPGSTSTTRTRSTPRPSARTRCDAVIWDKAGERVMAEAARRAATVPGSAPIQLYKNNTDNKGASYGCHENYLMRRGDAVRRHRPPPDPVLRLPAGGLRRRPGRHRRRTAAATASRSASAPTSSRSRSGWRPR